MPETVVHFQIRMPPQLHEALATKARAEKVSLNALIVGIIERAAQADQRPDQSSQSPQRRLTPGQNRCKPAEQPHD